MVRIRFRFSLCTNDLPDAFKQICAEICVQRPVDVFAYAADRLRQIHLGERTSL
jgi:hypothetical protein